MRVPPLEYHDPDSLPEALDLLRSGSGPTAILAGGTDIIVSMKQQVKQPRRLVDIRRLPGLAGIERRDARVVIGAMTPLGQVAADATVQTCLPALANAVRLIGSPNLRNLGTIGGNLCLENRCKWFNQSAFWRSDHPLCFKAGGERCYVVNRDRECHATYSGDAAALLMALGAAIEIAGPGGARRQPLEELYTGDGLRPLSLDEGEILVTIEVPIPGPRARAVYLKARPRGSIDFPNAGVALSLEREGDLCLDARIAVTGTTTGPVRVGAAEKRLRGETLTPDLIEEAAGLAVRAARPINTGLMSAGHKRLVVANLVREAFRLLGENDEG